MGAKHVLTIYVGKVTLFSHVPNQSRRSIQSAAMGADPTNPQPLDPYQQPAGIPPPGVTPNLGNGAPSQQSTIIGICSTFIILTTGFVVLRLYVALKITRIPALENCTPAIIQIVGIYANQNRLLCYSSSLYF
jgi:hypothetical protein